MTHNPDHLVCCGFPIVVDRGLWSATGTQDAIYCMRYGPPFLLVQPHARIVDVCAAALAASRGEYLTNDRSDTSAKE